MRPGKGVRYVARRRRENHPHIHIGSGTEISAQDRTKEREAADVMALAEMPNCGSRDCNGRRDHVRAPKAAYIILS